MKKVALIFLIIIVESCTNQNKEFQLDVPKEIIEGSNEIKERVLTDLESKDTFKYKSAVTLLDNFRYQKNNSGLRQKTYDNLINEYYGNQDSLLTKITQVKDKLPQDIESYDTDLINSSNLLNNIENTYKTLSQCSWKNQISLDTYCQYLLPYKINNEPFTTNWKNELKNDFIKNNGTSIFQCDLMSAATKVHQYLFDRKNTFRLHSNEIGLNIPDLSVKTLDKLMLGSCHEISAVGVGYMRALGIPAAIDFAPAYLNISAGHEWSTVIVDSVRCLPFDITATETNIIKKDFYFFSKVYRRTYVPDKEAHFFLRGQCSFLPQFFNNPFIKDVTNSYTNTTDISIEVKSDFKSKLGYICVFNRRTLSWNPVGWGKVEDGIASFKKVGTGGVYLAVMIEENGSATINSPFILYKNGKIKFLKPNPSDLESVKLLRKINSNQFKEDQKDRMIGGIFQGANRSDFKDAVELYTIKKNPGDFFNTIDLQNKSIPEFRYVRYLSPKKSFGNVGEIEFYHSKSSSPVKGMVIGTIGSFYDNPKTTREAAFDGSVLTFFDSNLADHSWVGLDLIQRNKITKIRFIARNDMNCVQIGSLYELFYWDDKWISLGKKHAETTSLTYKNVPKNSLLWLRNLTAGNEERIFTYENGKQVWW